MTVENSRALACSPCVSCDGLCGQWPRLRPWKAGAESWRTEDGTAVFARMAFGWWTLGEMSLEGPDELVVNKPRPSRY